MQNLANVIIGIDKKLENKSLIQSKLLVNEIRMIIIAIDEVINLQNLNLYKL